MKKIALFAGNNLTAHLIVNRLIPQIKVQGFEPVLYITGFPSSLRRHLQALQDYTFYESQILDETIYPYLESRKSLVDRQGKCMEGVNYSPKQLAQLYGIQVKFVDNVNDRNFINDIAADHSVVGGISIRNYQIFKTGIISTFEKKGFLWNLHMGILPDYRGVFVPARAMADGARQYGWTLHHVDAGIDTGNILNVHAEPLDRKKTVLKTYLDFVPAGVAMIMENLKAYNASLPMIGCPQPKDKGKYYTFPTAAELARWRRQGIVLAHPVEMVDFYVSAFSYPHSSHALELKAHIIDAVAEKVYTAETLQKEAAAS